MTAEEFKSRMEDAVQRKDFKALRQLEVEFHEIPETGRLF